MRWSVRRIELLAELKLTDTTDRVRQMTERLCQELIDAEAAAVIGAGPYERTAKRTATRNGARLRTLSTSAGIWSFGSRSPGLVSSSRRCWSAGAGSIRPCSPW